jgi:hypothetical protein
MPFITFFYKLKNDNTKYYGKFVSNYISDDHDGLDREMKSIVVYGINLLTMNMTINMDDVSLGILSFSDHSHIPTYSSDDEIEMFDFYYDDCSTMEKIKIYVNKQRVYPR